MTHNEDFEFVKNLAEKIQPYIEDFKKIKHKPNNANLNKLITVIDFCNRFINYNGGNIVKITPNLTGNNVDIVMEFNLIGFRNKWLAELIEILKLVDYIDIDASIDGTVCVDLTIKDVYIPIKD